MSFFVWEKRLNTGIEIIDQQHQRIATSINDLYHSMTRDDKGLVGETIIELLDYTCSHLEFEEQLLEAVAYPQTGEHKAVHERFNRRIQYYFKRHIKGDAIALPLISELKMWLTTHILFDDSDYVPYILHYRDYAEGVTSLTS